MTMSNRAARDGARARGHGLRRLSALTTGLAAASVAGTAAVAWTAHAAVQPPAAAPTRTPAGTPADRSATPVTPQHRHRSAPLQQPTTPPAPPQNPPVTTSSGS